MVPVDLSSFNIWQLQLPSAKCEIQLDCEPIHLRLSSLAVPMKELNLVIQKSVELLTELCAEQENFA